MWYVTCSFLISPISSELDKDEKCKTFFVVCGSTFSLNATIIIDAAGLLRNEDHHSKREKENIQLSLWWEAFLQTHLHVSSWNTVGQHHLHVQNVKSYFENELNLHMHGNSRKLLHNVTLLQVIQAMGTCQQLC